ncbi:unnamed protein product [Clonostachys rosea]|uniref:1-alkyl-2-acetylglycerophosphocholine esterase n=1 Tax=Bionectria ochroleuca TaxID=29856 RepID=A0ABY6TPB2_BIOOC|nr:unnamed protein product [Clonostachys rosea]
MARVICTCLSLFLILAVAEPDPAFSFGARLLDPISTGIETANTTGSQSVGIRRESFAFEDRQLNVSWWYPATSEDNATPFINAGGLVGEAVQDAPLDSSGGPYPLIIFSPGVASWDDSYYFFLQNLASHGYIVVSIKHLDATKAEAKANPLALKQAKKYQIEQNGSYAVLLTYSWWFRRNHEGLRYRPQEIGFVIDKAIQAASDESSPFHGSIDTENIGMAGHSLGGFYTLLVGAGMAVNCDYPMTLKEQNLLQPILTEVNFCAWPESRNFTSPTDLHDSRIKAAISLAPPVFIKPSEITRGANSITKPLMILTGNDPYYESTLEPQRQIYDGAAGPKYKVEINATNHMLIADTYQYNDELTADVPKYLKNNFSAKAEVYMTYSSAFFDKYLKKDESKKDILQSSSSPFVASFDYSE